MECPSLLCNVVLQDSSLDRWWWILDPINGYSVKGTYQYLTMPDTSMETCLFDAAWLKHVPLKVSVFVWRLLRNRLPTKDKHFCRRVLHHDGMLCVGESCGTLFTSGSTSISHLQSPSVNIFISLDTWRDYRGLLILFSK
uniref:H+-transporting two-sector ATPase, alpha/beta subunit, central region, related n=1 Tax=Medicago truncatula TaxID=3880 RepID=Q2HRN7_MEDTR|nr:H+-transporting two-sector ATPase, alpha/beta subunit, central region, related [Medicago truncatula]